mmetsp:Transcript_20104/g.48779  ORF Transcript_20104/g.48779 Transcript_20104/m.48779 type:complete len:88 (+) Transcript_20104:83-346(+)
MFDHIQAAVTQRVDALHWMAVFSILLSVYPSLLSDCMASASREVGTDRQTDRQHTLSMYVSPFLRQLHMCKRAFTVAVLYATKPMTR